MVRGVLHAVVPGLLQAHATGTLVDARRLHSVEVHGCRAVTEVLASAAHPRAGERILRFDVTGPAVLPPGVPLAEPLPLLLLDRRQRRANPHAPSSRPTVEAQSGLLGLAPQKP